MYVFGIACGYVYVLTCIHGHTRRQKMHIKTQNQIHARQQAPTCMYHVNTRICMCICTCICVCICICVDICIYICIYAYIHIYIYKYTCVCIRFLHTYMCMFTHICTEVCGRPSAALRTAAPIFPRSSSPRPEAKAPDPMLRRFPNPGLEHCHAYDLGQTTLTRTPQEPPLCKGSGRPSGMSDCGLVASSDAGHSCRQLLWNGCPRIMILLKLVRGHVSARDQMPCSCPFGCRDVCHGLVCTCAPSIVMGCLSYLVLSLFGEAQGPGRQVAAAVHGFQPLPALRWSSQAMRMNAGVPWHEPSAFQHIHVYIYIYVYTYYTLAYMYSWLL